MIIRRVESTVNAETGHESIDFMVENILPEDTTSKEYTAMRRKILREMNKQIDQLIAGNIDKITIVAI